ncbi:Uncharacterised protein [Mycobacterium tuberculosis]|nr:Uncharacterised protein [Mycobacterium tuberculosis]
MLMLAAVQDSAMPTQIPAPKVNASAVVEKIMVTRPSTYTNTPASIT